MEVANPEFPGWVIEIDGMVAKPMRIDVRDLVKMLQVGEFQYLLVGVGSVVVV